MLAFNTLGLLRSYWDRFLFSVPVKVEKFNCFKAVNDAGGKVVARLHGLKAFLFYTVIWLIHILENLLYLPISSGRFLTAPLSNDKEFSNKIMSIEAEEEARNGIFSTGAERSACTITVVGE